MYEDAVGNISSALGDFTRESDILRYPERSASNLRRGRLRTPSQPGDRKLPGPVEGGIVEDR